MLLQLQQTVLPDLRALDGVGFKVVLARGVSGVQLLTDDVLARMEDFSSIAPAHNPPYLAAIRQFRALLPNTPLIGAFETAFHRTMPPEAYCYSIPIDVSRKYDIRRNGFHGASIEYLTEWTQERMGRTDLKLVVCHLGGSGSICAVKDGRSIDTSLGLTLQCGTMHNNRCGDIDPYIIFYLVESCGMTLEEVKDMLQTKSGLYGMSGGAGRDMRDVQAAAEAGNEDAELAIRAYCYSIKKYIGSYAAAMGGLDAIVFGGGLGLGRSLLRLFRLRRGNGLRGRFGLCGGICLCSRGGFGLLSGRGLLTRTARTALGRRFRGAIGPIDRSVGCGVGGSLGRGLARRGGAFARTARAALGSSRRRIGRGGALLRRRRYILLVAHALATFSQSFMKESRPRSVSGCCTIFFSTPNGTVAMSAPMRAACVTWLALRIDAAMISTRSPLTVSLVKT